MKSATISMPLAVILPRKTIDDKKFIINLNNFMNQKSFMMKRDVKSLYIESTKEKLKGIKFLLPIRMNFTIWKRDKRKSDRSNVLALHEKFFCDALTTYGCIEDDNDEFIHSTHYYTGGIDKENPRVEITMREIEL